MNAVDEHYRVLFLCTGNSARSVIAEALLQHLGGTRFSSFSAGSCPTGTVHPLALEILRARGIAISEPRSKSWDEFVTSAPMDLIVTVCDRAATETCPVWPGHPRTAHWGLQDPAAANGASASKLAAFERAFTVLERRITELISLPTATMKASELTQKLQQIGTL
jgi:arsenate reductase